MDLEQMGTMPSAQQLRSQLNIPQLSPDTPMYRWLSSFMAQASPLPFRDLWNTDCPKDPVLFAALQPIDGAISAFQPDGDLSSHWDRLTIAARTARSRLDTEPMSDPTVDEAANFSPAFPDDELREKPAPRKEGRDWLNVRADLKLIRAFDRIVGESSGSKGSALDEALSDWIAENERTWPACSRKSPTKRKPDRPSSTIFTDLPPGSFTNAPIDRTDNRVGDTRRIHKGSRGHARSGKHHLRQHLIDEHTRCVTRQRKRTVPSSPSRLPPSP